MWRVRVVQSEQHMICRLTAGGGQGGPSKHGRNWQRKTAVSGSSPQLTLKKGAPGDQVWDLLCVQLASYLERGPLMWMMPLHLHVNQKSDYDYDMMILSSCSGITKYIFLTRYYSSYPLDQVLLKLNSWPHITQSILLTRYYSMYLLEHILLNLFLTRYYSNYPLEQVLIKLSSWPHIYSIYLLD